MGRRISKKEEVAIIEAINEGNSLNKVAKKFKRSVATVSKYAKENGIDVEHSQTKKAVETASKWNKARRFELIGKFFDKLRDVIQVTSDPRELKDLSTALGIVIDKARLEEGEPTEITKNENKTQMFEEFRYMTEEDMRKEIEKLKKIGKRE